MFRYNLIIVLLISCYLIGINVHKRNDANYIPKLKPRFPGSRKARFTKARALSVMALQSKMGTYTKNIQFDTDSAHIGIDNRCTVCISHVAQYFIGPLKDSARTIKGFAGTRTKNVKVGTLA